MMSRREIKGSRILLTGASSGIGRALALELARGGAELVVVARREDRLKALADEVLAVGGKIHTVAGDITEPDCRKQAIDAMIERYNGLDILVNNAGVGAMGLFEHADAARVRRVFEVNFFALVELTRLALPHLIKGVQPMVVNVSSILGHRAVPHSSEYSASKFAVQGFSEAIRAEFTRHAIDVLVVSPGTTETEFFDSVLERTGEPAWPKHTPITPEAVARQIAKAIRKGKHEIIPYFPGKLLCWLSRLSPRLMDYYLARYA
jgi:short-subunit dehydrogenase